MTPASWASPTHRPPARSEAIASWFMLCPHATASNLLVTESTHRDASSTPRAMPVRFIRLVTSAVFLVGSVASCGAFSRSAARSEARAALGCRELDSVFPRPHRYGNISPQYDLFRGCGKYAVLRCTYTSAESSCSTVEVLDAKVAESAAPMSFGRQTGWWTTSIRLVAERPRKERIGRDPERHPNDGFRRGRRRGAGSQSPVLFDPIENERRRSDDLEVWGHHGKGSSFRRLLSRSRRYGFDCPAPGGDLDLHRSGGAIDPHRATAFHASYVIGTEPRGPTASGERDLAGARGPSPSKVDPGAEGEFVARPLTPQRQGVIRTLFTQSDRIHLASMGGVRSPERSAHIKSILACPADGRRIFHVALPIARKTSKGAKTKGRQEEARGRQSRALDCCAR